MNFLLFLSELSYCINLGSVTSTDSAISEHHNQSSGKLHQSAITHAVSCDSTDSGHASMAEAVGGVNGDNNSPMAQRRSLGANQLEQMGMAAASTQQRQRLAASATHMLHRPNPALAFALPPPTGPRHLKGKAPLPPPPPPPAPSHPPKSYANVQIGRRPIVNSMGSIDENGTSIDLAFWIFVRPTILNCNILILITTLFVIFQIILINMIEMEIKPFCSCHL